jgi:peptidoglycan-N-acetylglucosamine deacetylase
MLQSVKVCLISALFCFSISAQAAKDPGHPIRQFQTKEKVVALTFDDGPDVPYTQQILDVLDKYHVKATFFVIGSCAKAHPELLKQIIAKGHDIGNHSWNHEFMKHWSVEKVKKGIIATDAVIKKAGYQKDIPFRGPFGINTDNMANALQQLNKKHVLFDFLPQDWTKISSDQIVHNVMVRMRPGLIITLHDGGKRRQQTVIATEKLIKQLQSEGYQFKRVSELVSN